MISLFGMQRANGDWFAINDGLRLRMPVFRSSHDARQARGRRLGMLLFKPVVLDDRALDGLASARKQDSACFWLVDDPSINLKWGVPLEYAQLVQLIREGKWPWQG